MIRVRKAIMAPALRSLFYATRDPTIISSGDFGSGSIIGSRGQIFMIRKRGNPNWGRPFRPATTLCTEFEMQATPSRPSCANGAKKTETDATSQNGCSKHGVSPSTHISAALPVFASITVELSSGTTDLPLTLIRIAL
jgi:hypothetical protein